MSLLQGYREQYVVMGRVVRSGTRCRSCVEQPTVKLYIEDDVELPVLTPNSMLNINPSVLPELKPYHIDNRDLRKRAKFMIKMQRISVETMVS